MVRLGMIISIFKVTLRSNECTEVDQNFRKLIIYIFTLTYLYKIIYLSMEYQL